MLFQVQAAAFPTGWHLGPQELCHRVEMIPSLGGCADGCCGEAGGAHGPGTSQSLPQVTQLSAGAPARPPQSPTLCRQTRAAFRSLAVSPLCWVEAAARLGSRVWRWGPK